jgi:hypothetical protein
MSSWASYGVRAGPGVHEGDCRRAPLSMAVVAAASAVESRQGLCPARGWNAVSIIMAWLRLGWRTDVSGLACDFDVGRVGGWRARSPTTFARSLTTEWHAVEDRHRHLHSQHAAIM